MNASSFVRSKKQCIFQKKNVHFFEIFLNHPLARPIKFKMIDFTPNNKAVENGYLKTEQSSTLGRQGVESLR